MWADISLILAISTGILTAVPGLMPPAGAALATWSRVVSGIGWLGYAGGLLVVGHLPDQMAPGLLAAQIGYGLAVLGIARQSCRDE